MKVDAKGDEDKASITAYGKASAKPSKVPEFVFCKDFQKENH